MFREILTHDHHPAPLILTPNRRLASRLQQQYSQQTTAQKNTWVRANIFAIQDWVSEQWLQVGDRAVISPTLALLLWEQTIMASSDDLHYAKSSLAQLCSQAHNYLQQWLIDHDTLSQYCHHDDHQQLCEWVSLFEQTLAKNKNLTSAMSINALQQSLIENPEHIKDTRFYLYGFDELSPSLDRLFSTLAQCNQLEKIALPNNNNSLSRIEATDQDHEYLLMTHWAKQQAKDGKLRIGCVVPQMNRDRDKIKQAFDQCFNNSGISYNLSSGQPLIEYDMISTALNILHINPKKIDIALFNQLLNTPYLCGNVIDQSFAAFLSQHLLSYGKPNLSSKALINHIQVVAKNHSKASLPNRLLQWLENLSAPATDAISWLSHAVNHLNTIGWPGQRGFDSLEHQLYQHWQEVLTALAKEQHNLDASGHSELLAQLRTRCQQHLFQIKTDDCAIQVLGALEAAGNDFDCMWISGLNDQDWPAAAKPHPLLPYPLQREHKLPHADAAREYHYCQQLTDQLIRVNPVVIVSHPTTSNGHPLQVSALTQHIPLLDSLSSTDSQPEQHDAELELEIVSDDTAPSVQANEAIRGGSGILSRQANCPFQAFAHVRLQAKALGELQDSIDALDKGSLVHAALDFIWKHLKHQSALITIKDGELSHLIDQSIAHALDSTDCQLNRLFEQAETYRLKHLINQWLEHEKQRPNFAVKMTEQRFSYQLKGLKISLVLDRLDELDSGEQIVIDYKTGTQSLQGWFDDRLTSPQLPLYATMPDVNADAICFAEVKRGKYSFKGVATNGLEHPGIKSVEKTKATDLNQWSQLVDQWKQQLSQLADDFQQGIASVDPANNGSPCQFCDLQPLCRINH